jgi:hypothetical protein
MKPINILKKIIETAGKCDFATPNICKKCPLSKLKSIEGGGYINCLEAVGAIDLSKDEADLKYLDAANSKLLDMEMERVLEGATDDIE